MLSRRLHQIARTCSVIVIAIGGMGIVGLAFEVGALTSGIPGLVSIKINTAVAFVVAGSSLLLQMRPPTPQHSTWAGRACGLAVAVIGGATLFEYISGVDLHIDQIILPALVDDRHGPFPGRMASLSAAGFILVGTALWTLDASVRMLRRASQVMAFAVLLMGFVTCTGYSLGATAFYAVSGLTAMAIHTAV